jgi:hypothetical protein
MASEQNAPVFPEKSGSNTVIWGSSALILNEEACQLQLYAEKQHIN